MGFEFKMPSYLEGASLSTAMPVEIAQVPKQIGAGRPQKGKIARIFSISHAEFVDEADEEAEVCRYFGGKFRFLPRWDVVIAMRIEQDRATRRADRGEGQRDLEVCCLTCGAGFAAQQYHHEDEETGAVTDHRYSIETMFGMANDHARTTINHAVGVRYADDGKYIFFSQSDPLHTTY